MSWTNAYQHLSFLRNGRVLTIVMNRPEVKNAANVRMHRELSTVFSDAQRDPDSDILVLTGAGDAFSSGGDIRSMVDKIADRTLWNDTVDEARALFYSILDLQKPLIARVNGAATGLGATLAVYADISIAAESAVIGDPHVKVGLAAGDGGALMWPMLVGFQRAKELLFLGDNLSATEAAKLGLVTHAVPDDELDARIDALTARLQKMPPVALRGTKRAINHTLKQLALATFEFGVSLETQSQLTQDHAEAVNAFVEKRKPAFTGR
ncbi:enoyl-CoA hydratase/isomerase family protein [Hydrogenophaga laconesensis]|uniref:Enoyl-CoA hydratase n=1 Tax=Hydrogenophaga laconesensis TaxID=1805971 RepID=A0ABU1VHI0_9BURK|nr:enoyl-CoA hydratase-related protein [Hydrogenophaga laconesensis]MDR7096939.1 enoyl-CoA hydratase [Hydrogenophaga laconesensis]